jgi:hypothetical protein
MKHKLVLFASIVILHFSIALRADAQWVQTNCPGSVWCFAVNGTNIYAGISYLGGVSHSTDSGTTWTESNAITEGNTSILALATSGTNVFAGTSDSGIFRSSDNGASWISSSEGLTFDTIDGVFISVNALAAIGTDILAGTDSGVFRSTNDGDTWSASVLGLTNAHVYFIKANGSNIFCGNVQGLFLSTNNGASWKEIGFNDSGVSSLAIMGSNLFASAGDIFLSTDNGESWKNQSNMNLFEYTIEAVGTNLFAGSAGSDDFLLSTDQGVTWTVSTNGLPKAEVLALAISGNNIFASTYEGSVYRRPLSDFNLSGVSENALVNSTGNLQVFPNPASGNLQILGAETGEVHLFDLLGREVLTPTPLLNGDGTLDVSHLEPGMYFVRSGNESVKVEISH